MVAKITSITKKHAVFTITLTAHLDKDSKYQMGLTSFTQSAPYTWKNLICSNGDQYIPCDRNIVMEHLH